MMSFGSEQDRLVTQIYQLQAELEKIIVCNRPLQANAETPYLLEKVDTVLLHGTSVSIARSEYFYSVEDVNVHWDHLEVKENTQEDKYRFVVLRLMGMRLGDLLLPDCFVQIYTTVDVFALTIRLAEEQKALFESYFGELTKEDEHGAYVRIYLQNGSVAHDFSRNSMDLAVSLMRLAKTLSEFEPDASEFGMPVEAWKSLFA